VNYLEPELYVTQADAGIILSVYVIA